jgi:hypothetical protein
MREILKHVQEDTYRTLKCPEPYLIFRHFYILSWLFAYLPNPPREGRLGVDDYRRKSVRNSPPYHGGFSDLQK